MSVARFSEDYGIGRTKAYEELNSGRLRGRKIGTRTLISEDDAEAWFQCLPARALGKPRHDSNEKPRRSGGARGFRN